MPTELTDRHLVLHPRVALRPEPFGALAYHYGTRRLVFLKHPDIVRVVRSLSANTPPWVRRSTPAGSTATRWPRFVTPCSRWSTPRCSPKASRVSAADARPAAETGPRRADLPHLGAHLRVQPAVRALPLVVGPPRPARAHHGGGVRRARRAAGDAGVLHQHRRRRADGAQGLLRHRRLRGRQRHRRQVLDQRRLHHAGQGRAPGVDGLPRRADQSRRTRRRHQRPRSRRRLVPARHGGRWTTSPRRGSVRSRSRSSSPATTSTSSTGSSRSPTRTARRCASPACGRRAAAPTRGTSCIRPTSSSDRSTAGCSTTATPCSPATRSSTSTPSANRCRGSTCAAPVGWSA